VAGVAAGAGFIHDTFPQIFPRFFFFFFFCRLPLPLCLNLATDGAWHARYNPAGCSESRNHISGSPPTVYSGPSRPTFQTFPDRLAPYLYRWLYVRYTTVYTVFSMQCNIERQFDRRPVTRRVNTQHQPYSHIPQQGSLPCSVSICRREALFL
jgi:hypothetical protein